MHVPLVHHTERRRRAELAPEGGLGHPVEVLAEEDVRRGTTLHQRVHEHVPVVQTSSIPLASWLSRSFSIVESIRM